MASAHRTPVTPAPLKPSPTLAPDEYDETDDRYRDDAHDHSIDRRTNGGYDRRQRASCEQKEYDDPNDHGDKIPLARRVVSTETG